MSRVSLGFPGDSHAFFRDRKPPSGVRMIFSMSWKIPNLYSISVSLNYYLPDPKDHSKQFHGCPTIHSNRFTDPKGILVTTSTTIKEISLDPQNYLSKMLKE